MSATEVFGGLDVECPWCGKALYLYDAHADGVVEDGWESDCGNCGKLFVVNEVDYDVTVRVDRVEPKVKAEVTP